MIFGDASSLLHEKNIETADEEHLETLEYTK
jgi:hypothetical protein